jgi:hypothetical protein
MREAPQRVPHSAARVEPIRRPSQAWTRSDADLIPTIGALIRETPGTISLGQGVAHTARRARRRKAVARALPTPRPNPVPAVAGAGAPERLPPSSSRENGLDVRRAIGSWSRRREHGFCHRAAGDHGAGDEII